MKDLNQQALWVSTGIEMASQVPSQPRASPCTGSYICSKMTWFFGVLLISQNLSAPFRVLSMS